MIKWTHYGIAMFGTFFHLKSNKNEGKSYCNTWIVMAGNSVITEVTCNM